MKSHLVHDLLTPVLGLVGFAFLLFFSLTHLMEFESARKAAAEGVASMACKEVVSRDDLTHRYLKVTNFKRSKDGSFYVNDDGDGQVAFVIEPVVEKVESPIALVVQSRCMPVPEDAKKIANEKVFSGTLRTAAALNFTHQQKLANIHPDINFDQCYVLLPGALEDDPVFRMVGISLAAFFGLGTLVFLVLFLKGIFLALKNGITVEPEKDPFEPKHQTDNLEFVARKVLASSSPVASGLDEVMAETPIKLSELPKPHQWLTLTLLKVAIAATILCAAIVFVIWGVGWAIPIGFFTGLFVFGFFMKMAAAMGDARNLCRVAVTEDSIPSSFRKFFHKKDVLLTGKGYQPIRLDATNLAMKQVTRVYLSDDKTSVLQITKNRMLEATIANSVLLNGQVSLTADIPLPSANHPLLTINTTGVPGDVAQVLSVHNQLMNEFADVIIRVQQDEVRELVDYIDGMEKQALGMVPMQEQTLPGFRDLFQQIESDINQHEPVAAEVSR